jgi:hypothetical protein
VVDAWLSLCYHMHTAGHVGIGHASSKGAWTYNAIMQADFITQARR